MWVHIITFTALEGSCNILVL